MGIPAHSDDIISEILQEEEDTTVRQGMSPGGREQRYLRALGGTSGKVPMADVMTIPR